MAMRECRKTPNLLYSFLRDKLSLLSSSFQSQKPAALISVESEVLVMIFVLIHFLCGSEVFNHSLTYLVWDLLDRIITGLRFLHCLGLNYVDIFLETLYQKKHQRLRSGKRGAQLCCGCKETGRVST